MKYNFKWFEPKWINNFIRTVRYMVHTCNYRHISYPWNSNFLTRFLPTSERIGYGFYENDFCSKIHGNEMEKIQHNACRKWNFAYNVLSRIPLDDKCRVNNRMDSITRKECTGLGGNTSGSLNARLKKLRAVYFSVRSRWRPLLFEILL